MGRQVVYHHDVARLELGAQNLFHIRAKGLAVGSRGDRHHRFDTAQTHGPQRGQDFPVALRGVQCTKLEVSCNMWRLFSPPCG